MKFSINLISRLTFNIEAERLEEAQAKALNLAGVEYEVENRQTERFFFVSYNGLNPEDNKTVIGHHAFSSLG